MSLVNMRPRGGPAFRLTDLFKGGQQGLLWLPESHRSALAGTAGATPTLFEDSSGTIAVSAVGRPVGQVLDESQRLVMGPELALPLSPENWSVSGSDATHIVTFSNGTMRYQSGTTSPQLRAAQINSQNVINGGTYLLTVTISNRTSGGIKVFENFNSTGLLNINGVGTYTARFYAPALAQLNITRITTNVDMTISSISLRELRGNHAAQSISVARPILVDASGLALDFDGLDDVIGSTFPAGTLPANADVYYVMRRTSAQAALAIDVTAGGRVFGITGPAGDTSAAFAGCGSPSATVNGVSVAGGSTAITRGQLLTATPQNTDLVLEVRGVNLSAWAQFATVSTQWGAYAFAGLIRAVLICPAQNDAKRARIRRRLAQIFGIGGVV